MRPVHKARAMTVVFADDYTHSGVQPLILWIMDSQGISQFELSKRSGVSPAAIHQILKKGEKDVTRPPRKSTLAALAKVVGGKGDGWLGVNIRWSNQAGLACERNQRFFLTNHI